MKTVLLKGHRDDKDIECLRLKSLYICVDMTENRPHLIYDAPEWHREMKDDFKFDVQVSDVILPVEEDDFNEFSFSVYEVGSFSLFLFQNLAVMADGWDGIKLLCKEGVSFKDAAEKWAPVYMDERNRTLRIHIPRTAYNALAVKLERLSYDVFYFFRGPEEYLTLGERLETIADYARKLHEASPKVLLADIRASLAEYSEMYTKDLEQADGESKAFYQAMVLVMQSLMNRADALSMEQLPEQTSAA